MLNLDEDIKSVLIKVPGSEDQLKLSSLFDGVEEDKQFDSKLKMKYQSQVQKLDLENKVLQKKVRELEQSLTFYK